MRALKVLVVIMGILLIMGFIVLGVMVSRKLASSDFANEAVAEEHSLPKGFKVVKMMDVAGSLVLHLRYGKDQEEQVVIIDPESGKEIARLTSSQSKST